MLLLFGRSASVRACAVLALCGAWCVCVCVCGCVRVCQCCVIFVVVVVGGVVVVLVVWFSCVCALRWGLWRVVCEWCGVCVCLRCFVFCACVA